METMIIQWNELGKLTRKPEIIRIFMTGGNDLKQSSKKPHEWLPAPSNHGDVHHLYPHEKVAVAFWVSISHWQTKNRCWWCLIWYSLFFPTHTISHFQSNSNISSLLDILKNLPRQISFYPHLPWLLSIHYFWNLIRIQLYLYIYLHSP